MKNTVTAQVNFSFKGENLSPSIVLELDSFAKMSDNFSGLYSKIAQQNNIDTYSYTYDAMEANPLFFHSPTGNVIDFVINGECNLSAYRTYLKQTEMLTQLEQIASNTLGITDLNTPENEKIKNALMQAYQQGSKT